MTSDLLILVDEHDNQIGTEEKLKAHVDGSLHRAFSIFIFNNKKELLLQKRAFTKYHCPGLWTNTCCSHPRPNETTMAAAHRRLQEEVGFNTDLQEIFSFIYNVPLSNGLIEHEFDHVFIGVYEGAIEPNPEEVDQTRWISHDALEFEVKNNPEAFTPWFLLCYSKVIHML